MCILQIAFNITALIVLNIKPGPVSEELQRDYYPLIEGMFSLPINLPWTIYGKAFRVSTLSINCIGVVTSSIINIKNSLRNFGLEVITINSSSGVLIVVFLQARKRILKNLKDFLDSRPVKDDIYDQYLDLLEAELPEDTPRGQKCDMAIDLLTSLIFAGHDTTAATMVFAVKYIGENPKVLAELRVSLQMPQSTYS